MIKTRFLLLNKLNSTVLKLRSSFIFVVFEVVFQLKKSCFQFLFEVVCLVVSK
jgi:hypothetical protein